MSSMQQSTTPTLEESSTKRTLHGYQLKVFTAIAVFMSLFHIYVLGFHPITPWILYTVHLGLGAVLVFFIYPIRQSLKNESVTFVDLALILSIIFVSGYLIIEMDELVYRIGVAPTLLDLVVSVILIVVVLEITRRTTGLILPILALIFILYANYGSYFPGVLEHRGYSWDRILSYLNSMDAIYSVPIGASASFVFLFILFGAFLNESGGSNFFINFAIGSTGRKWGVLAKDAVIYSILFGYD